MSSSTRRLIRVCTVCLNYKKLRIKWNSRNPRSGTFSKPTLRENRHTSALSALISSCLLAPHFNSCSLCFLFLSACALFASFRYLLTSSTFIIQSNLNSSNTDGSFTMDNSNSFFSTYDIFSIIKKNRYSGKFSYFIMKLYVVCTHYNHLIEAILMSILNMPSLYRRYKNSLNNCHFLPDLVPWLTPSASNYPYLEQIPMFLKMFEPLKFDCIFNTVDFASSVPLFCSLVCLQRNPL